MGLPILSEFVSVLMGHPLLAWFTVIFVLISDTFVFSGVFVDTGGLIGTIISEVFGVIGLNWVVSTQQLLIIIVVFPLLLFALNHSGK